MNPAATRKEKYLHVGFPLYIVSVYGGMFFKDNLVVVVACMPVAVAGSILATKGTQKGGLRAMLVLGSLASSVALAAGIFHLLQGCCGDRWLR